MQEKKILLHKKKPSAEFRRPQPVGCNPLFFSNVLTAK